MSQARHQYLLDLASKGLRKSNYNSGGFYTGTPSGTNCTRPPTVVWFAGTATLLIPEEAAPQLSGMMSPLVTE